MKALVTGATGFVGGLLASKLRETGTTVVALVRHPDRARDLTGPGVEVVIGDLADRDALRRAATGCDLVYHVAGAIAARDEAAFMAVNREGTKAVVDAAVAAGIDRFVLVSSLAAAGPATPGQPHGGAAPERPVTQYGRSKLAAEAVVRESGLRWTILRPPAVYGPRDRELLRVFRAVARLGIAPVFGAGHQELSLVYGPDLVDALIAAGSTTATIGTVYYPAHPEVHTSRTMVQTIARAANRTVRIIPIPFPVGSAVLHLTGLVARLTGRTTLLTADKGNELFQPAWTCRPDLLTAATGWRAAHDLASGATATLAWYRQARWL